MTTDLKRGTLLAAKIAKAIERRPCDEAKLGRANGVARQEYFGQVIRDMDSAWRYLERAAREARP